MCMNLSIFPPSSLLSIYEILKHEEIQSHNSYCKKLINQGRAKLCPSRLSIKPNKRMPLLLHCKSQCHSTVQLNNFVFIQISSKVRFTVRIRIKSILPVVLPSKLLHLQVWVLKSATIEYNNLKTESCEYQY